eukprot:gene11154-biopygen19860
MMHVYASEPLIARGNNCRKKRLRSTTNTTVVHAHAAQQENNWSAQTKLQLGAPVAPMYTYEHVNAGAKANADCGLSQKPSP